MRQAILGCVVRQSGTKIQVPATMHMAAMPTAATLASTLSAKLTVGFHHGCAPAIATKA